MQSIQAIWDRIEAWLKTQASPVLNDLRPGASQENIQPVESFLGMVLPEDLKASYRVHNGSNGRRALMDMWRLLSLEEMVDIWKSMRQIGDTWSFYVDIDDEEPENEFREGFWLSGWIPFMNDGCGGYGFIDLIPSRTGHVGQILALYHAEGPLLLAPSLQAYLSAFADHLEAGKYVLNEFGVPTSEDFLSM